MHPADKGQQALFLQIQFVKNDIDKLTQKVVPIPVATLAATTKANILVWLVKDFSGNKVIEDNSSNDVIVPFLQKTARDLNLLTMLPVVNLQDPKRIKAEVLCDFNVSAIQAASQIYGVSTVVVGCLAQHGDWGGEWLLLHNGISMRMSFDGASAEEAVTKALHEISKNVGSDAAMQNPNQIILRVTGISDLDQYAGIVKYLRTFSQVTQVDVQSVSVSEMQLRVNCVGGKQVLVAALHEQKQLIPENEAAVLPAGVDLNYRWTK